MGNQEKPAHLACAGPEARTSVAQDEALLQLARATVQLSQLAPRLCTLATRRQEEAQVQAAQLRASAQAVRDMAGALEQTIGQLQLSADEIAQLSTFISRIADETRIISINSGIVAARAGEQGRAFAVLASEIRALSENTAEATRDVQGKVERLGESTRSTVAAVGLDGRKAGATTATRGLGWLLGQVEDLDRAAGRHVEEARELNTFGGELRQLSEDMIACVGTFRLELHARVERLLARLRERAELASGDPARQHACLRQVVTANPWVDLAYVTSPQGVQTLDNVARGDFRAVYGDSGMRKDWSARAWFRGALASEGVCLSPIYRSQATDAFCLTASATFSRHGRVAGVVAVDISIDALLDSL